ncbi:GAF domain-containing protein, partial [bacterium CPR1]|nr:GAF domain-containing protein [bacterium CPR1]
LCFAAVTGPKGQQLRGMRLPLDESSVAGYSLLHRQTICLGDAESDPRQSKKTDEAVGFVTRSLISCPFYLDGAPAGVLQLVNKHVDIFSHQDVHTVQVLAAQAAVAVSVSRQSRQVEALRWRVLNGLRSSMQRSGVCSLEQGEQVASLAARLGQEFLLGERETEVLRMAGFLYRVDLTLLESVGIFADLVPILRGRTDRYDEAGEAQPRLSRILAVVADWVELARSGRSEEAWDRLREGFGTRYDPLLREVMQGLVATREASLR